MHMNKEVEKTLDIIHTNQHLMADNLPTGWNTAADSTIFWSNFVQIKSNQDRNEVKTSSIIVLNLCPICFAEKCPSYCSCESR